MAMDMLKRSLELLAGSTVTTGKQYLSNIDQLYSDSRQIQSGLKDAVKQPFDFIRGMLSKGRGGGIYKFVTDWFYQRSNEYEQYSLDGDDEDDEFDAGMGDSEEGGEEESSPTIDAASMKNIARGQVGAMYQIGQKQVEASLSNTSEIVSQISNRSAEIITSVNNLNKTVLNIDKNLSIIASSGSSKDEYKHDADLNPFAQGQVTLGGFANTIKQAASENAIVSMAKILLEGMKQQGPSVLTDLLVGELTERIKIGDKSIKEHADTLNEKFGNAVHGFFSNIMDSDFFKDIFGDVGYITNNFSSFVKSDYNKKKATFDGMTRKTIVEIIPEYLKKITKALTGETWNISKKGKLTTKNITYVSDTMTSSLVSNSFNRDLMSKGISEGKINYKSKGNGNDPRSKISERLFNQMQEWLTMGYGACVFKKHDANLTLKKLLEYKEYAIRFAWRKYTNLYGTGVSQEDFEAVCNEILDVQFFDKDSQYAFSRSIERYVSKISSTAMDLGSQGYDVGRLTDEKIDEFTDPYYRQRNVYTDISQERRAELEEEIKGTSEYEKARRTINSNTDITHQYDKLSVVKEINKLSSDEREKYVDTNGRVTEKGLLDYLVNKRILTEVTDDDSTAQLTPTFYSNDYKGNIGSLVLDIYKHLTEGITKVQIVSPSTREQRGPIEIFPEATRIPPRDSSNQPASGGIPSKLNLNVHGCGPIALTDLASRMAVDGSYDPMRGTTVGDYISTAASMGVNLHPGQATQRALTGTSPTHPTTVLGSGYGFGTPTGQLHYMNVVGSDGNGNVYTSNPMYGDGKYPVGAIANNSIMGLYGNGYEANPEDLKKQEEAAAAAKAKVSELTRNLQISTDQVEEDSIFGKVLTALGLKSGGVDKLGEKVNSGIDSAMKHTEKPRGFISKAKVAVNDWIDQTRTNVRDDINNSLDTYIANAKHKAKVVEEGNDYAKKTKESLEGKAYSDEDKQLVEQALSMMQAALQDGDGESDLNAIKKVINKIKNDDLRNELLNNVSGLINRSKQKIEVKPQSKLGKILLFGVGLLKKVFSPLIKGIKAAFNGIKIMFSKMVDGIKKYGKRVLKFLAAPYIKGATMISTGASAIKEGLVGSKKTLEDGSVVYTRGIFGEIKEGIFGGKTHDREGNEIRKQGLIDYIKRDAKTVTKKVLEKSVDFYINAVKPAMEKVKANAKYIGGMFKELALAFSKTKLAKKIASIAVSIGKLGKGIFEFGKNVIVGFPEFMRERAKKFKEKMDKLLDKLSNSKIVQGFFKFIDSVPDMVNHAKEKLEDIAGTVLNKIRDSKLYQGAKAGIKKFKESAFAKKLGTQMKVIGKGGADFGKGFIGGWRGVWKDAEQKGKENVEKAFADKNKEGESAETAQITNNATENAAAIVTAQQESTQQLITAFQEVGQNIVNAVSGNDPNTNNGEAGEQQEQGQEQNGQTQEQGQQEQGQEQNGQTQEQGQNTQSENQQQSETQQQTPQTENQQQTQEQGQNAQPENQQQSGQQNTQTESQQQTPQQEPDSNPQPQQQNPDPNADGESGGESGSGGNKLGRMGKIGGLLGKIVGGIGNIYGGIFKIVATAAMQLSGFKTIIKLVKSVITTAIRPLNKLFRQIVKTMKPILKTLTSSLTKLVEGMTKILTSILEKLTPFLEPLFNVVTDIMGAIGDDLISIITGIVKLLNPLVEGILKVAIPVIKTLHGVLEALFGGVMMGLGKIVYGIGAIISDVNVFKLEALKSVALKMMQQGNDLALAGQSKFYSGMARTIDAWSSPKVTNDNSQTTTNNSQTTVDNSQTTIDNSQTTVINQETASEIIGSGDTQASYGTFMNMNKHGCGPIALAENINRRNSLGVYGSGDVDPRSLTVGMYNAGLYNENKGTSVADYLTTSRALGYNMTAGGVDYRSLKQASPTNPITLVGSGTGFGTKTGNTHYINVVGNDGAGSAYVSNPLTGRISKASMSELALNSKLGIYGSGPDDEKKSTVTATEQSKIDAKAAEINKTETEAKVKEATETKSGTPITVKKKDDETVGEIDKAKSDNLVKDVEDNTVEVERHGLEKAGHATVTTASGAAIGAGIGTAIVPGLGTLIGAIGGGLVGLLGGLFSKKDISEDPQQRRIELERQIHSGNYNADEVKVLRRILEDDIAGRLSDNNVYVVGDDVDDSGNYSGEPASINTINPEDLDFSAESIVDRYGTSTTISTLISGLKDLAANFLSIFNPEDTSTEEGQQKYLKRLKKEMGSDAYNQLRAYAFLQFFKEYPPTGLESCEPGNTGAGIYAARFKMHEYDYIKKYKDLVTTNLNNKLFLFPEADLKKFAREAGISEEVFSSLNAQQLAEALCGNIDGLSSGSVNAALLAAESADSATRSGMNSSNAEFNNTAYTGSDGKTYKALGFTPNLSIPSNDNKYYKSSGGIGGWSAGGAAPHPYLDMLANCSGYAYGRFHEEAGATSPTYFLRKYGHRDGGSFVSTGEAQGLTVDKEGKNPRPGDVISWKQGSKAGHVAIVEEVQDNDHITIAHSAYNGFKGYNGDAKYFQTKKLTRGSSGDPWPMWTNLGYRFAGFVHNPGINYEVANNGSAAYGDPSQLFSNGGSVDENIYRYLISKGMSGVGAAGMMGCMKEESGLKSNNLEDKFQKSWGYPTGDSGDVQYTQNVNSGKETQNMFVNSHGTGKAGYGLTQFTASNVKQALYNNTVAKGKSIDDYGAQLDSVLDTLKGSRYNGSTLYDAISNSTDPVTANKLFLWRYEAGTGFTSDAAVAASYPWMGMGGINKRHTNASAYYNKFKGLSPYTPQQSGSNASAINPYADQQFVSGAIGGTGGKDSLIKTTASIYEAYEKVMPKNFDNRYQNSLYSKPITLRNGKTRKLRPDCSGIVSAGIQEMGYKLKGIGDEGKRSWEFAGPTSNTMILDQNGNPSRDWEVLQFSRDKLQPGDITAGYWKTHGHVSMPIVHLDKTMPQGLDGGGNTNITNSINVAKQLLAGKSYSSVDYGPRSSGHYAMGSSWDSKTGGGAQRIWRYVGGSKDNTTPQYDSRGFKLNTGYHTAYMITRKNGSDILVDSAGNRLGSVMNVKTIAGGGSGFYNSTPKPFRMSSKWQTADKDNWLYDYIDGITGAGDTSSSTTSSVYVPPIDTKNLLSDVILNQDGNKSTNNYYIAKDSSAERREELNILLSHTFNIRSESMEAILTEMLEELKKRGGNREPVAVPSPATTPSLFNDDIPPQIERLMLG